MRKKKSYPITQKEFLTWARTHKERPVYNRRYPGQSIIYCCPLAQCIKAKTRKRVAVDPVATTVEHTDYNTPYWAEMVISASDEGNVIRPNPKLEKIKDMLKRLRTRGIR